MNVTINGKNENLEINKEKFSIIDLLKVKDVEMPDMVSVELNGTILNRSTYESTFISEGDKIEFLYFMGGGSGKYPAAFEKIKTADNNK